MEYCFIYPIVLEWNETTFWNRKKDFQELLFFLLLQKRESVEVILHFLPSFQTLYPSLLNTTRTHNSSPFTLASFYYFLAHLVKLGPIRFLISYYFIFTMIPLSIFPPYFLSCLELFSFFLLLTKATSFLKRYKL